MNKINTKIQEFYNFLGRGGAVSLPQAQKNFVTALGAGNVWQKPSFLCGASVCSDYEGRSVILQSLIYLLTGV
jgi:hypothetical protein